MKVKRFNISFTLVSLLLTGLFSSPVLGQDKEYEVPSRWYISPDFGLIIGNTTSIEVIPSVGYHLTHRLSVGAGGRYEYYRQLDPFTRDELVNTHIWGIRGFSRFMLIPGLGDILPFNVPLGIFVQAEMEGLNLESRYYPFNNGQTDGRIWHNTFLAGAGISQQSSARSFVNIVILWDVTNPSTSPYTNPVIRFGIQIYL